MKYLIIIIGFLIGGLYVAIQRNISLARDRDRLSDNQHALMTDVQYYRTSDSLSAASVERLTLTNKELKESHAKLAGDIENLNLKLKRIQSISNTATETKYEFKTQFRDSIVVRYVDSIPQIDTVRCVKYANAYIDFLGCIRSGDWLNVNIQTYDTLQTIVHRIPRKFLFFRWGTKAIRQEVVSRNPYSNITYTEYIELKK
jgi:hypothetical protein